MSNLLNLAVLCGGQTTEHDISILSAQNIVKSLNPKKYHLMVIYIAHDGHWWLVSDIEEFIRSGPQPQLVAHECQALSLVPGDPKLPLALLHDPQVRFALDCIFPVLHGTLSEDGAPQGLLEMLNVPYVGSGVVGSALCIEKHISKAVLRAAGLPTADWLVLSSHDYQHVTYQHAVEELKNDILFIKPASLGSSVGIEKVRDESQFKGALQTAFGFDDQVLIEPMIEGREIECSVLGNEHPVASLPGEFITQYDFYSYDAKYLDDDLQIITPADLPHDLIEDVQSLSIKAFSALQCKGMARVDFFLSSDHQLLINEVNTIPGFTDVSMYPKNWAASGLHYTDLLDKLIQLALKQHNQQKLLAKQRSKQTETTQQSDKNWQ